MHFLSELCLTYWFIPYCSWIVCVLWATRPLYYYLGIEGFYFINFFRLLMYLSYLLLFSDSIVVLYVMLDIVSLIVFILTALMVKINWDWFSIQDYLIKGCLSCVISNLAMVCFSQNNLGALGLILATLSLIIRFGAYPFTLCGNEYREYEEWCIFMVLYRVFIAFLILIILRLCVFMVETGWLRNIFYITYDLEINSWNRFARYNLIPLMWLGELPEYLDRLSYYLVLFFTFLLYAVYHWLFYSLTCVGFFWFIAYSLIVCKDILIHWDSITWSILKDRPRSQRVFWLVLGCTIVFQIIASVM